jgi:hypothetical protein
MKKLLALLALTAAAAAVAAPARAEVGISVRIGDPGFYGILDIGNAYRPRVVYSRPVVITRGHRHEAPVYLRVPRAHYTSWARHCGRYGACGRPVYFVHDDWYRSVYVPAHRRAHGDHRHNVRDRHDRRHERRHDRRDDRRDHRDHRNTNRRDARWR